MTQEERKAPGTQIQETLSHLQKALEAWNQIPEGGHSEVDELRLKTRELIFKLREQIQSYGL